MINTNSKRIEEVLNRGVENVYPNEKALKEKLLSGDKIKLYCGYDPSGPSLHLGHMITLRKLSQFQALGHRVVMLIGDFTGMIGDPTDKLSTRKKLSREEVLENSKNYKKIASNFLDFSGENPAKILYNSEWQDKLTFRDVIELASNFTVQQMLARDMFDYRLYGKYQCDICDKVFAPKMVIKDLKNSTKTVFCPDCQKTSIKEISPQQPIYLHEFLYPLAQAYDSVEMGVDLEIGGNDQTFNMLRGRDLMKIMKNKEKFVMALKLLTDSTGKKMGKTEGNFVALDDSPKEIFGKIMSWPDSLINLGFELLTDLPSPEENPREAKAHLAKEIIKICHGRKEADSAEKEFNQVFKDGGLPSEIPEISVKDQALNILDLLVKTNLVASKSEAKRLIIQGGVKIDGQIQDDWQKTIEIKKGQVLQVGKRKFAKII